MEKRKEEEPLRKPSVGNAKVKGPESNFFHTNKPDRKNFFAVVVKVGLEVVFKNERRNLT